MKSFLDISDLTQEQILKIVHNEVSSKELEGKNIGCLFEKPSTRTKLSFFSGISNLGGNSIDIKLNELNFARQESLEDTFRAFSCYLDGLVYRTEFHERLVLASKITNKPVINALSEKSHPCQTLADLITLFENFKTLNLEITWFGDLNNVLYSLVEAVNIIENLKLNIFSHKKIIENCDFNFGDRIFLYDKIDYSILKRSHCIMTDVFVSMNDQENDLKINQLIPFQVNKEIMSQTKESCVFMHCLPAKIGFEVTKDVIESNKSIVWKQAYNRLPAQERLMQCINW